ncbi:hypothetical protein OIU74_029098 [Salix koriyanagi]|uniref:Uncharacterized protein n=1 Tax=Salix koriyanagi TaxID=2511006 RepID=A0A9Q0VDS9_9ROSI|nr:hypothetical protein OIU74_029098 [Salix koriyanagi]
MVRTRQETRTEPPSFERRGRNQSAQGWQNEDPLDDTASHAPIMLPEILQRGAGAMEEDERPNETREVPPVTTEQQEVQHRSQTWLQ